MGDHDDLPICRKKLQQRRLHEQSQPLEQLDEMIETDQEADVEVSTRDCQQGEAEQKGDNSKQQSSGSSNNSSREMEQRNNSKELFGIQEDFNSQGGELMSRSS
jgi:hypothetical protein